MELAAGGHERAYGPYPEERPEGTRYRVVVVGSGGRRASKLYESQEEAEAVVRAAKRKVGTASVGNVLALYIDHLRLKGNKARTISTTEHRLTRLINSVHDRPITDLTPAVASKLYRALASTVAVDTHRNTLGQARTWGRWMVKKGHLKRNPWLEVEAFGERNYGKPQLRIDEARRLWKYIKPRLSTDEGALAVAVVLMLGLRASEVVAIVGRDVDADGTILWIDRGKTRRSRRQLEIPPVLSKPMQDRGYGRLFPHRREWVLDMVKRRAVKAGLTHEVTAHGLRGLHATLKVEYEAAQRALGHKPGSDVTEKHYLAPGTIERATARRVWDLLDE